MSCCLAIPSRRLMPWSPRLSRFSKCVRVPCTDSRANEIRCPFSPTIFERPPPSLVGWVSFSSFSVWVWNERYGSFSSSCRVVLQTASRLFALGPIFPPRQGFQAFQRQGPFAFAFAFAFTPRTGFRQFFFEGFPSFSKGFQTLGEICFFLTGQRCTGFGFFGNGNLTTTGGRLTFLLD